MAGSALNGKMRSFFLTYHLWAYYADVRNSATPFRALHDSLLAVFRDPILTDLERRVAEANLDVRTATIRLAQSRFQRGVTAAAQFPSINGDAKYTRELYSQNGIISLLSLKRPSRPVWPTKN